MNGEEEFDVEREKKKNPLHKGFDGSPVDVLTHEEKEHIRELLAAGISQKEIAEKTGRSAGAIRKVMKTIAAASRSRVDIKVYSTEERGRLIDLTFEKYEELLVHCRDGNSFRALVGGLRELIDVRRAEEGLTPSENMHKLVLEMQVIGARNEELAEDDLPDIVDGQFTQLVEGQKPPEQQQVEEKPYDPLEDI